MTTQPTVAAPPEQPPIDPRRAAIDRIIRETVARRRSGQDTSAAEPDPLRDAPPPEEQQAGESADTSFDVRTFLFLNRPSPADRASLVSSLAQRLAGHVRRGGCFRANAEEDRVDGKVDPSGLYISFSGAAARSRWLPVVQEVAREKGLVEPE